LPAVGISGRSMKVKKDAASFLNLVRLPLGFRRASGAPGVSASRSSRSRESLEGRNSASSPEPLPRALRSLSRMSSRTSQSPPRRTRGAP
jgi:hypothetical protein